MRGHKCTNIAFVWLFPLCDSRCNFKLLAWTNSYSHRSHLFVLFFYVRFQMSVEITCTNWFIATLGAFVWFFSRMLFQMAPQWTWPISSKFTLAALVSLFFYLRVHINTQPPCQYLSSFCFKLNRIIGWKVWWKARV